MGAFVVAAGLIVGFIAWRANDLLTNKVVETLEAEVTGLREQFQAGGAERLAAVVAQRSAQPGSSLYLLVDAGGPQGRRQSRSRAARARRRHGRAPSSSYRRAGEESRSAARHAVGVPLPVPGGLTLIVGRDIEDLHRFAGTMGQLGLWSIVLLRVLGIGAGLLISRSVLRRIEAVTETSRKIMAGDLSKRIPLHGSGDELDRLSESLNAMLGAHRGADGGPARGVRQHRPRPQDAAHPPAQPRRGGAAEPGRRCLLPRGAGQDHRGGRRADQDLQLAAADRAARGRARSPRAWCPSTRHRSSATSPSCTSRSPRRRACVWRSRPPRGLRSIANRELVSQAVANLVDNAIKYSVDDANGSAGDGTARGSIGISLTHVGERIEIAVADRGPGVAPEDRERALRASCAWRRAARSPAAAWGSAWSPPSRACTAARSGSRTTARPARRAELAGWRHPGVDCRCRRHDTCVRGSDPQGLTPSGTTAPSSRSTLACRTSSTSCVSAR